MSYSQRLRSFVRFAFAAGRRAAAVPCDVVFATSTPLTIALPGVWAKWRLDVPMVFEVRDLWPELPIAIGALRNPLAIAATRWLERFAYRHSEGIVALSPGMRDGVTRTGYPPERVSVIPNSSDLDLFTVPAEAGANWRGAHPEIGERPMVLYAGTIGRINGVDWLARVAKAAEAIDPSVCFVVLGEGGEAGRVRESAKQLGVLGGNFFMLPSVPKERMPEALSAATVCSSLVIDLRELWHNSANKFFDALAAGRPIVINHRGWQADLLEDHDAGLVLPVDDAARAARMLTARVRDREWLTRASEAATRLARERFDRDLLAGRLEEVLLAAVQGRTGVRECSSA